MKKLVLLLIVVTGIISGCANPKKTVIHLGTHYERPQSTAVLHQVKCEDVVYEMKISKETKQVLFTSRRTATVVSDLSGTPFANVFLERTLFGKFGFNCAPEALVVYFIGVELQDGAPLKPVTYTLNIQDDGTVRDSSGLRDRTIDYLYERALDKKK